eukprot:945822-Prymnesium_polylepis.1
MVFRRAGPSVCPVPFLVGRSALFATPTSRHESLLALTPPPPLCDPQRAARFQGRALNGVHLRVPR